LESGSTNELRHTLLRTLAREPEAHVDSTVVAAAAVQRYERLAQQLAPLIGDLGVSALWARSVHLTEHEFSWLAQTPASEPDETPFSHLRLCLARQPAATATEAAASLLATFCRLLGTLIGNGLTTRMMREAWPDIASENTPEEKTST
jgi:hypothetical protein